MREFGELALLRADARRLPVADDSVDLIVTSPPYFALRSYRDEGEHYAGQIGDEPTPAEFVDSLIEVTRECMRVLKPSGSLWVNLGDSYSRAGGGGAGSSDGTTGRGARPARKANGIPTKSLSGIPWRYALRCIDDLGLILRAEVIWSKPNGLPESVTDRVRRSHEQWFHFTLQPRYFSAVDEIREPHKSEPGREGRGALGGQKSLRPVGPGSGSYNTLGALPGSVWTVPTEPLRVPDHLGIDHFAAFPTEWPKRIIQGWSPAGVCVECGEGRRPVSQVALMDAPGGSRADIAHDQADAVRTTRIRKMARGIAEHTITGYACACTPSHIEDDGERDVTVYDWHLWTPPATTPAVVLDPFGGTGTTAMVAKALGRHGISVDMSADYCRIARWRTHDRNSIAKVLGVGKVVEQPAEQGGLW